MERLPSATHDPELFAVHSLQQLSIPFARVYSAKHQFGIWRAFVMLPEVMSASEDIWQR
jgi:hypothetical protein